MQKRRRNEIPPALAPDNSRVDVPSEYWDQLQQKDINALCNLTLFEPHTQDQLIFHFLNEDIRMDIENRCLKRVKDKSWVKTQDPLLELVTLLYLINVNEVYPIGKDIVGEKDLKEGHFFKGPHALKIEPLIVRYGHDINGFKQAAEYLEGQPVDMADAAYRLLPFPRIPLYYLFWEGDAEFEPRISILFDRSIENVLQADAIWGLVNRVSTALLIGPSVTGI